jgi:nitrite reductase (NADH) small subunit/3-phenylpropionate/trans-cinnamate dioxygenase ferredoxin subunit
MPIKARCGRADDIPPGGSKVVQVRELAVAIFNVAGAFYAVENTCPHQGGPLGEGYLEENGVISCPWHGWTFDLRTGVSPLDPDVRVGCYPVRVEDGLLVVELPG